MIRVVVLLAGFVAVAVAVGRGSPHAEYIKELQRSRQTSYSNDILEDAELDVPSLISKYGYPSEVHKVVTADGYILEAHRIPHGRDSNNNPHQSKPVVFLMHGLLSSSADFLVLGTGNALAYLLAEAGYDVWLGNARGNYYSRLHKTLDPDSQINQNFWRFSWDDIGNHDLPAFVDYILEHTGQEKLHYIGHSQGGTTFLVLNSLRPEYNEKFISFQGLAPAAFFANNEHSTFTALAPFESIIELTASAMGIGEIFPDRAFIVWFQENFCSEGSIFQSSCGNLMTSIFNNNYLNETILPLILSNVPAGASVRQIAHYGQNIRFNTFRRYNYNAISNILNYGQRTPPDYDLSKITVPSYLHYGLSDKEVNFKDLLYLAEKLSNVVTVQVERESFNHFDFIWASDARTQLYDNLLGYLKDAESKYL